jgi:uncharacterized membrane protein
LGRSGATESGGCGSRGRLLWLQRQLGHSARAREIEEELRQLLQVADRDFALLRLLN